ncbi:MAG: tRNA1(Val) (adenine(37)-N6)-methyltransferase [Hyphomicrobiaceae bacterium]
MPETPSIVTNDAFLGGRIEILQPKRGYRAGLDAVLLAAAVEERGGREATVLDAGAGVGVAGLAVARRLESARVTLVERDQEMARLARDNIDRNGLSERCSVVEGDVSLGGVYVNSAVSASLGITPGRFTHVIANPPFHESGKGTVSATPYKARAHQMRPGLLERWVAFMATAAVTGGELLLVHRAAALGDVLSALDGRFGDVAVLPVHTKPTAAATRILVRARKASRAPLRLFPPLVVHDTRGAFTPQLDAILRHGASLADAAPELNI